MKNNYHIAILPGDGIGPEVIKQAYKVLNAVKHKFKINITTTEHNVGGNAIDLEGTPLPIDTIKWCEQSNAILFGSVGGPKWDNLHGIKRPEKGALLTLRKHFNLFINIRPIYLPIELIDLSPIKTEIIQNGLDIVFIRELIGGIYFSPFTGRTGTGNQEYAFDTGIYYRSEIERIAHFAFKLAQNRKKKITSIDKSNVLSTSMLWRETVSKLSENYPDVQLQHLYVDNAAMQLIRDPSIFDVILCPNLFGDILSDECAMISGSIGILPSASLNTNNFGLYEPSGGSAPDIAGKNIANPIAQILSIALLFRHSLHLNHIAQSIEKAVFKALKLGYRTLDIIQKNNNHHYINTDEMGNIIASLIYNNKTS